MSAALIQTVSAGEYSVFLCQCRDEYLVIVGTAGQKVEEAAVAPVQCVYCRDYAAASAAMQTLRARWWQKSRNDERREERWGM